TALFQYHLFDKSGNLVGTYHSDSSFEINNLFPGIYHLKISTALGCDTSLIFEVKELPNPTSYFELDSVVCRNTPIKFITTSMEPYVEWIFGDGRILKMDRHPEH